MKKVGKTILNVIKILAILLFIIYISVLVIQRVSNNKASLGGYRIFTVVSESMVPKYNIGDILIVKNIKAAKIKVGDDLCYLGKEADFKDKVVTHAVKEVKENNGTFSFITEGIANVMPDPEVQENQIYGVVKYKTILLSFINKCLQNKFVFFLVIFIPIVIYAISKIIKAINDVTEENDDEEKEEQQN